jgi:hypothetical protein
VSLRCQHSRARRLRAPHGRPEISRRPGGSGRSLAGRCGLLLTISYVQARPWADLIANIRPDQWNAPTPCTEWTVRDVVNHLVATNLVFAALIGDDPMPERGADHLGNDPVEAYSASAEPQSVDGTAPASTGSRAFANGRSRRGCKTDRASDGTCCRAPWIAAPACEAGPTTVSFGASSVCRAPSHRRTPTSDRSGIAAGPARRGLQQLW